MFYLLYHFLRYVAVRAVTFRTRNPRAEIRFGTNQLIFKNRIRLQENGERDRLGMSSAYT